MLSPRFSGDHCPFPTHPALFSRWASGVFRLQRRPLLGLEAAHGLRLENSAEESLESTQSVPRGRMIVEIVK